MEMCIPFCNLIPSELVSRPISIEYYLIIIAYTSGKEELLTLVSTSETILTL